MGWLGGNDTKSDVKDLGKETKKVENFEGKVAKETKKLQDMKEELNDERNNHKKKLEKVYEDLEDKSKKTDRVKLSEAANKLKKIFEDMAKKEENLAKLEAGIVNDEMRASSRIKLQNAAYIKSTVLPNLEIFIKSEKIEHIDSQDIARQIEIERDQLGLIIRKFIDLLRAEDGGIPNSEFGNFVKEQRGQL